MLKQITYAAFQIFTQGQTAARLSWFCLLLFPRHHKLSIPSQRQRQGKQVANSVFWRHCLSETVNPDSREECAYAQSCLVR